MPNPSLGSKDHIHILKGVAILAVVGIHIVNLFISRNPAVFIPLDQVFRFSVPLFVALSGFALAAKYSGSKLFLKEFYSSRLLKLLPLYFLWTFIYFITSRMIPGWGEFINSFPLWQVFFYGRSEFHLYFVPMIFQAYLLFPVFYLFIKKFPYLSLLLSALFQLIIFTFINTPGWNDQSQYVLFISWQVYFVLGVFLAIKSSTILKKLSIPMLLIGLFFAISTSLNWFNTTNDLIWATRFTRFPIMVYSIGIILFLLTTKITLPVQKTLTFLGIHSYHIYLSHILFLHILVTLL